MQPHLRLSVHAAIFMQQHACSCIHVALTPHHWCRSSHAAALVLPLWCCSLAHSSIFQLQHLAANLTLQHSRLAFTLQPVHCSIWAAALAGALCRWKQTTWSAFSNAEHDTGGREQTLVGARRGGAELFEKGCFGWWGCFMYVHIP